MKVIMPSPANQNEPRETEAKTLVVTHPIHCPMCRSLLKVVQHQAELMFCVCCGVSVTVPAYSWKKYEPTEH